MVFFIYKFSQRSGIQIGNAGAIKRPEITSRFPAVSQCPHGSVGGCCAGTVRHGLCAGNYTRAGSRGDLMRRRQANHF